MSALSDLRDAIQTCISAGKEPPYDLKISKRFADEILSSDAVEVVRCGECRYVMGDPNYDTGHKCSIHQEDGKPHEVWLDDFCSWGERREDG